MIGVMGFEDPHLPFFVYGTLMRGHHNHERLLAGLIDEPEPAFAFGVSVYGMGHPIPFATPDPEGMAFGEIIRLRADLSDSRRHLIRQSVDALEGMDPTDPNPRGLVYSRIRVTAHAVARPSTPVECWLYIRPDHGLPPQSRALRWWSPGGLPGDPGPQDPTGT